METRASCLDYSNKSLHVPGLSEEENINLHLWLCSRPELQINLTTDIHLIFMCPNANISQGYLYYQPSIQTPKHNRQ